MAGVKVTDLTSLGSATPTDIMYIVDTGSNQSRQIEVQNIYSGMPQLDSGQFSISPSGETDCIVNDVNAFYSRVNNIVTCTYMFELIAINGATSVSFNLAPPIASTFAAAKDATGVITLNGEDAARLIKYSLYADFTFGQISFIIEGDIADFNFNVMVASVQYIII